LPKATFWGSSNENFHHFFYRYHPFLPLRGKISSSSPHPLSRLALEKEGGEFEEPLSFLKLTNWQRKMEANL
jgi:hypothetical protein